MAKQKTKLKERPKKNERRIWFNAGMAQGMVILNGLLLSVTAFLIMTLFVQGMIKDEYRRTSDAAGDVFAEKIIKLENAIRVVSGILLLSDNPYQEAMPEQIRRSVAGLGDFDQLLWIYEARPGFWQFRMIFETTEQYYENDDYKLVATESLITKIVRDNFFQNDALRVATDLPGMNFAPDKQNAAAQHNPFALIKVVQKGNSRKGVLIGVARPGFLMDQGWLSELQSVGRVIVRDSKSSKKLYELDNAAQKAQAIDFSQDYSFFVGDSEWKITLEFLKKRNVIVLSAIPYVLLLFGGMLTIVGALFVRNNQNQSKKLAAVNKTLEHKNFELEQEVAERERLNRILEKTSKDNRAIIDSVSDVIFETDTRGKVLFLSASWRKITGFAVEHSRDTNLFSMLHPEDQERQRDDFDLLVAGQKTAYRSFCRIRTSDGTFRAVEIAISMIRQDDNKNLRVVGTITDVEERRRAERALAEAEKKYRLIVENAAGGLFQITPEGMYLNVNPAMARILGYASVEDLLRTVKNVNGPIYPDVQQRNKFLIELTTLGQIFGYECRVARRDGSQIWVSENVRVVRDEQNNILYLEGSMEDITKRKEAEIALREAKMQSDLASRTKTDFIANMSHELRTPLNAIIGFSEIMKDQVMGPLGQNLYIDYAKDIHKSGLGLLKIINEILDIAKIESGKRELREKAFDFGQALQSVLDQYQAKLREKKITLTSKITELPSVFGEETALKQAIGNIYSNAIKFSPQGGRVTIVTDYAADGGLHLSITDVGVGMTQKEIDTALSPFGQLENRHDRAASGTGLGLPLAKSILELHGGTIEITSQKGHGTTVLLSLPAPRVLSKPQATLA